MDDAAPPFHQVSGNDVGKVTAGFVTGPGAYVLISADRSVEGRIYQWRGLATKGYGDIVFGSGHHVPEDGQSQEDALRIWALTLVSGGWPPGMTEEARAYMRDVIADQGEAAVCLSRFIDICGEVPFQLARETGPSSILRDLAAVYGRERIEPVIALCPMLSVVVGTRLGASRSHVVKAACDRIVLDSDLTLRDIASCVVSVLERSVPGADPSTERGSWITRVARLLRAMGRTPACPRTAFRALVLCRHIHPDWMPSDAEALGAMVHVVEAAAALMEATQSALDIATLLAPVRGDWTKASQALARHAPASVHVSEPWAREVVDMANAYEQQVLFPAIAHARTRLRVGRSHRLDEPRHGAALRALFAGKGILAVAEANANWHRRGPAMTRTISTLSGLSSSSFPVPFPEFVASNGFAVVPLLSAKELVAEGAAMAHCVGSYAPGCRKGRYAIASVRAPDGTRSTTVRIVRGIRVVEHRSRGNGPPPAPDRQAVGELVERNRGLTPPAVTFHAFCGKLSDGIRGTVRRLATPAWTRRHPYDPSDPLRILRAASLWEHYLPRTARGSIVAILAASEPAIAARLSLEGHDTPLPRLAFIGWLARQIRKAPDVHHHPSPDR